MNAQEEIKARLEVAQLYEEMGQNPKAARYYLAAAEICLKHKIYTQGQGYLQKVLTLDPENAQAQSYLERLQAHLEAHGMGAKSEGESSKVGAAPQGDGKLTRPIPALYLSQDQISAILSQVTSAPNPKFFPFDPLPKVDKGAIARKAAQAEAKREEQRAKERTAVASSFSSGESSFKSGAGFLSQVQGSGRKSKKEREKAKAEKQGKKKRRRGGANQSLAESIAKRARGG